MTTTSSLNRILRRTLGIEIHKTRASFDDARLHVIDSKRVTLLLDGGPTKDNGQVEYVATDTEGK